MKLFTDCLTISATLLANWSMKLYSSLLVPHITVVKIFVNSCTFIITFAMTLIWLFEVKGIPYEHDYGFLHILYTSNLILDSCLNSLRRCISDTFKPLIWNFWSDDQFHCFNSSVLIELLSSEKSYSSHWSSSVFMHILILWCFQRKILLMWLRFFIGCIVSLIFLRINRLSLSTTFFWSQLKVVISFSTVFCNFMLW